MDITRLLERIRCVDVSDASVAQLTSLMNDLGRLKGWVASTEAAAAHRATELEAAGETASASDLISRGTKSSRRAADKAQQRGAALGEAPEVARQLERGRISVEHADALASAAGKLSDEHRDALFDRSEELALRAGAETPAQFGRTLSKFAAEISCDDGIERSEQQRDLATLSHGINTDTGMGWVRADLHPDDYQKVKRRLDADVEALKRRPENERTRGDQLLAGALVGLVTGARSVSRVPAEVVVLIDEAALADGGDADSVCEYADGTPLPAEAARRHACDAKIVPAVLTSNGLPLDVGRGARHATAAQRHALRAMYRTCAVDGCDSGFDRCEMHHIVEWIHRGPTDLENLVPLCSYHHHRAHEGRWRLQLDPSTRQLSVFLPDDSLHSRALPDMTIERRRRSVA